jgi:hypothetical protein
MQGQPALLINLKTAKRWGLRCRLRFSPALMT